MYHVMCFYYGRAYWFGVAFNHFAASALRQVYINQYPDIRLDPKDNIHLVYDDRLAAFMTDTADGQSYPTFNDFVAVYNNHHRNFTK